MKAIVNAEFRALRPGDKKNSTIEVGEIVEGNLARAAIENGFGEQVPDDAPVGKELVDRRPPAKAAKGKGKTEGKGE
jgi:hypothetical protein